MSRLELMAIPISFNLPTGAFSVGSGVRDGLFVIFPACQTAGPSGVVLIGTVGLISFDPIGEHTLSIRAHLTPSQPAFNCPQLQLCDSPAFTRVCVPGGQAFINSSTDCTVAVKAMTWSKIKQLYN